MDKNPTVSSAADGISVPFTFTDSVNDSATFNANVDQVIRRLSFEGMNADTQRLAFDTMPAQARLSLIAMLNGLKKAGEGAGELVLSLTNLTLSGGEALFNVSVDTNVTATPLAMAAYLVDPNLTTYAEVATASGAAANAGIVSPTLGTNSFQEQTELASGTYTVYVAQAFGAHEVVLKDTVVVTAPVSAPVLSSLQLDNTVDEELTVTVTTDRDDLPLTMEVTQSSTPVDSETIAAPVIGPNAFTTLTLAAGVYNVLITQGTTTLSNTVTVNAIPVGNKAATVNEFNETFSIHDAQVLASPAGATIPLSGTTDADDGDTIRCRIVESTTYKPLLTQGAASDSWVDQADQMHVNAKKVFANWKPNDLRTPAELAAAFPAITVTSSFLGPVVEINGHVDLRGHEIDLGDHALHVKSGSLKIRGVKCLTLRTEDGTDVGVEFLFVRGKADGTRPSNGAIEKRGATGFLLVREALICGHPTDGVSPNGPCLLQNVYFDAPIQHNTPNMAEYNPATTYNTGDVFWPTGKDRGEWWRVKRDGVVGITPPAMDKSGANDTADYEAVDYHCDGIQCLDGNYAAKIRNFVQNVDLSDTVFGDRSAYYTRTNASLYSSGGSFRVEGHTLIDPLNQCRPYSIAFGTDMEVAFSRVTTESDLYFKGFSGNYYIQDATDYVTGLPIADEGQLALTGVPEPTAVVTENPPEITGEEVFPAIDIATAASGTWSGNYPGVTIHPSWMRPEVWVDGSAAPVGTLTSTQFASGLVIIEEDQSNLEQGVMDSIDELTGFWIGNREGDLMMTLTIPRGTGGTPGYAKTGASVMFPVYDGAPQTGSDSAYVTTSMRALALGVYAARPGTKVAYGIIQRSGTVVYELLKETDDTYSWPEVVINGTDGVVDRLTVDGSIIGLFHFSHGNGGAESPDRDDHAHAIIGIMYGTDENGNVLVPDQFNMFATPTTIPAIDPNRQISRIFNHAIPTLLTGETKLSSFYTGGALPADDTKVDNQAYRYGPLIDTPWLASRVVPTLRRPNFSLQEHTGTGVNVHFMGNELRGHPHNFMSKGHSWIANLGLIPAPEHRIDNYSWSVDGTKLTVWSSAGDITTQARIDHGLAATNFPEDPTNAPGTPGPTEVLGITIRDKATGVHRNATVKIVDELGNPAAAGRLEIVDPNGTAYFHAYHFRAKSGGTVKTAGLYKDWIDVNNPAGHHAEHLALIVDPTTPYSAYSGAIGLDPPLDPEWLALTAIEEENGAATGVQITLANDNTNPFHWVGSDAFTISNRVSLLVEFNTLSNLGVITFWDTDQGSNQSGIRLNASGVLEMRTEGLAWTTIYDPIAEGDDPLTGRDVKIMVHYTSGTGIAEVYRDHNLDGTMVLAGSGSPTGGNPVKHSDRDTFMIGTEAIKLKSLALWFGVNPMSASEPTDAIRYGIEMTQNGLPVDDWTVADGVTFLEGYARPAVYNLTGIRVPASTPAQTFTGINQTATRFAVEFDLAVLSPDSYGILSSDGDVAGTNVNNLHLSIFSNDKVIPQLNDIRFKYEPLEDGDVGTKYRQVKMYIEGDTAANRVRQWRDFGDGNGYVLVDDETIAGTGTLTFNQPELLTLRENGGALIAVEALVNFIHVWLDPTLPGNGSQPTSNVTFGLTDVGGVLTQGTNYVKP